ncbi:hypothetical protein SHIRM173S_07104 [Streptomyces hirsutus]
MGDDTHGWTAEPGAAERARSVLATAWSCAVTAEGSREEFVGAHGVADDGRVLLHVPEDSALLTAAICAPRGEPSAVLEFADGSPRPGAEEDPRPAVARRLVHHRGRPPRLPPHAGGAAAGVRSRRRRSGRVRRGAADPLATAEARLLTHLADCHGDAVERLTRLVEPNSLHGVVRVQPLAVDRHGLTLRIERVRAGGDVRLPFHRPADDLGQLTERMHVLLSQASAVTCPRPLQRQRADGDG